MFLLIPIQVDVPMRRWPFANWLIILSTIGVFIAEIVWMSEATFDSLLLSGVSLPGLISHMFLHADVIHLAGNMLFLWVFGNAICAKVNNVLYPVIYIALGLAAAVAYSIFNWEPALGASGAINGIVGMYLVFYPRNDVTCFWIFFIRCGTFSISGIWMILFWLAFDIWGAISSAGGIAYWAHIGGFAAGAALAYTMLRRGWITMESAEQSLLDVWAEHRDSLLPDGSADQTDDRPGDNSQLSSPLPPPFPPIVDSIRFDCGCGQRIKVPHSAAGKRCKCPACGVICNVPSPRG